MRLRLAVLAILAISALASFSIQLTKLNSAVVIASTNSFTSLSAEYCLQSEPTISKSQSFGGPNYTAKIELTAPWSSTGLLIGLLSTQHRGQCYKAKLRLSPGFENSRIFFVAKLRSDPALSKQSRTSPVDLVHERFLESLKGVSPDAAGLVAGLSIGETSKISSGVLKQFKDLSLSHLTAVSGTNCAIVVGMVWLLLPRLRIGKIVVTRWPRFVMASTSLLAYEALVGFQPSVLRAGAMTLAVLFAKTVGRKIEAISALITSAFGLLVIDPWLIFDYGFLLSVLACIGILILAPALAKAIRRRFGWLPLWVCLAISVSGSAQLLCFPILLLLQPGFSTYSVLANLLVEPLVAPITVIGISSVVMAVFFAPLANFLTFVASLLAQVILFVADLLSDFPYVTGYWPSGVSGLLLASGLAVVAFVYVRFRILAIRRVSAALFIALSVTVIAMGSVSGIKSLVWARSDWFMVSCDVGQGDATVIRSQGKIAVIDVGREPELIDRCLTQLGVTRIDFLVLSHFDLDHVGGLPGALNHREIEIAMLTSFVDDRPGADIAKNQLADSNVALVEAETGQSGELGEFVWQVLSPHRGAPEAEDSNDGSVTMLWRSSRVDIITLADLGEKGQMRLAAESSSWMDAQLANVPLIMKVSHHGSADQYPELIEALHPQLATVSVGRANSYGHPTQRTLELLAALDCVVARTDEGGSVSISLDSDGLALGFEGEQGKTG